MSPTQIDTVTPTQADKDALIKISRLITSMHVNLRDEKDVAGDGLAILARHRLAAEATQAAEIARLKQELHLHLPPASISGDYGQGWVEGQAWMINCIRGEEDFDKAVPLTHALVEKDDEIARLREVIKKIDEQVSHALMGDWSIALREIRKICRAALSAQPSEQEGGE